MSDRPRFTIILEALPGDVPVAVRLRAALKRLLRSFGLKCVEFSEATREPPGERIAGGRDNEGPDSAEGA